MNCQHCGDQVCIRHEREGVIHRHGRYGCRNRKPGQEPTVAEVEPWAEERLLIASMVKIPVEDKKTAHIGRRRPKSRDESYEEYE